MQRAMRPACWGLSVLGACALCIFGQTETDPGPGIWLIPMGAVLLCASLFGIARAQRVSA
jgi:hypothetical protein